MLFVPKIFIRLFKSKLFGLGYFPGEQIYLFETCVDSYKCGFYISLKIEFCDAVHSVAESGQCSAHNEYLSDVVYQFREQSQRYSDVCERS